MGAGHKAPAQGACEGTCMKRPPNPVCTPIFGDYRIYEAATAVRRTAITKAVLETRGPGLVASKTLVLPYPIPNE